MSQQLGFVIISERGRRRKRRWEDEKGNGKEKEEEEEKRGVMALLHARLCRNRKGEKIPPSSFRRHTDTALPNCTREKKKKKPEFPTKTQFAPPRYGVGERERDRGGWGLP